MDYTVSMMSASDAGSQLQIYRQLRALAARQLRGERTAVISPNSLVHEVWIKLAGVEKNDDAALLRADFLCHAGRAMRQVLVDHARKRHADKRIPQHCLTIVTAASLPAEQTLSVGTLLQLDAALHRLECIDADMVRVVELRYFGGFTLAETATAMHCSERKVSRLWTAARAWLLQELA